MAEEASSPRLGRGLAALIGDVERGRGRRARSRRTARCRSSSCARTRATRAGNSPRSELDELAASIRERGIVQPILVRPCRELPDGYEIVAGERRWRAAQRAGLHEVPVIVVEVNDRDVARIRASSRTSSAPTSTPSRRRRATQRLMDEFSYTQAELAEVLGKSRSHVANTLRLLQLPEPVRELRHRQASSPPAMPAPCSRCADPEAVAQKIVERGPQRPRGRGDRL